MHIPIKKLENRDHYVVPSVLIVEGVLPGSQGPILYPAAEIRASAYLWNSRPVVVYHPAFNSNGSAGNPEVFSKQRIGILFNVRFEERGKRLLAESWIDVERVQQVDPRVLATIRNKRMMEISTGLFVDSVVENGSFNGREYKAIAYNYRPDHLAILPDQIGACSIRDGAGLIRNSFAVDLSKREYDSPLPLPAAAF